MQLPFDPQSATRIPGENWLKEWRRGRASVAEAMPAPDTDAEEWRYSRIADLPASRFIPVDSPDPTSSGIIPEAAAAALEALGEHCGHIVTVDGVITSAMGCADAEASGVTFGPATSADPLGPADAPSNDAFSAWNAALAPTPVVIEVPAGAELDRPMVVVNHVSTPGVAAFPRLVLRCGDNSRVSLIEVNVSDDVAALFAPVTEVVVAAAARVSHCVVQDLGPQVAQVGTLGATVAQQATWLAGVAQMGGDYARLRIDCHLDGRGAAGDVAAAYLAGGERMVDLRTFQRHQAPDTTSDLYFKGALADSAHSVYTGMIHIAEGARGTDAVQANRVVKLSEDAWAESVPNLEIENNDVRCAHASTVGPVDEEQQYYLESRGVPPDAAQRLIVGGFFDDALDHFPVPEARVLVTSRIDSELDRHLAPAGVGDSAGAPR